MRLSKTEALKLASKNQHLLGRRLDAMDRVGITHVIPLPYTIPAFSLNRYYQSIYVHENIDQVIQACPEADYDVYVVTRVRNVLVYDRLEHYLGAVAH